MQAELVHKARARRRVALTNVSSRHRDATKVSAFRNASVMSPAQLSTELGARRQLQVENIFAL